MTEEQKQNNVQIKDKNSDGELPGNSFAFLGDIGSYSHEASIHFAAKYNVAVEPAACKSFADLFDKVSGNEVDFGVIPLENSTCGTITANYDLLLHGNCHIVEEHVLAIEHHLIGLPGTTQDEIREVYSHPAALEQCTKLFRTNRLLQAKPWGSTVTAVQMIKESGDKSKTAIASKRAALESKLEILASGVQDYENNTTRFALLKNGPAQTSGKVPDNYKISIIFQLPHEKGTLAKLLTGLAEADASLTKIESRPIGNQAWHYNFFGDFSGICDLDLLCKILDSNTESYRIIGTYPVNM